uniref:Cirhin n=1 Tax=Schistosoma japonicum TaxID=6182 RepID=C1LF08_SCHJA|nr:Cirhin [Schistosoma japonicum]
MDGLACHHIYFYEYQPSPFLCLARNESGLIAAGRSDGSVDVYDENRDFFIVSHFPRTVCCSVESVVWIQSRLFCTGALGRLLELDLLTSSIKGSCLLIGSPVARCMTVFEDNIIVGSDEGFITFFSTDGVDPVVNFTVPKVSGKILSIACTGPKESILATGTSTGSLLLISIRDNVPKVMFTLSESNKSCLIWTLLFAGGLLFSGDSRGVVSIWDISVGGQVHSFSCHHADVLALASNPDGSIIFSGGADAIIRRFELSVSESGDGQWQCSGTIRGSRRDIHGLAFIPGRHHDPSIESSFSDVRFEPHRILAVGQDACLQIMSCESVEMGAGVLALAEKTLAINVGRPRNGQKGDNAYAAALPFWPPSVASSRPSPMCFVTLSKGSVHGAFGGQAGASRHLCLLHYPDKLCLVRLGQPVTSGHKKVYKGFYFINLGPLQIVEIHPSKGMEFVRSSLSPCGFFIAYSDFKRTRLLKLDVGFKNKRKTFCVSKAKVKPVEWHNSPHSSIRNSKNCDKRTRLDSWSKSPSNTSSSETETDTDEIMQDVDILDYFTIDKPFHSSIENERHMLSNEDLCDFSGLERKKVNSATIPSSCLLAFTPKSEHLLLVTQKRGNFMCISVDNGSILWDRNVTQDDELHVRAHIMSISNVLTELGYLIALGCSDARVRLYDSLAGSTLFICPCIDSVSGHSPLPVSIAFPTVIDDEQISAEIQASTVSKHSFSVLYTNSQLREWRITIKRSDNVNNSGESDHTTTYAVPTKNIISVGLNKWLIKFWRTMGDEIAHSLGVFHSVDYFGSDKWLLASDRFLVMLVPYKNYKPGMIKKILTYKRTVDDDYCLYICENVKNIIQTKVLSKSEIAVVSIHSGNVAMHLAPPLQRKLYGT